MQPELIITETLENGLKIYLKEIHSAPIISHWIWFRIGARYEQPGLTGLSHWVEHMQFKGTQRTPGTQMDRMVSREGGLWNAFTHLDWTTYFETMPANKIDIALDLEADRMFNSLFEQNEVESERTVIIAEKEGKDNDPLSRLNSAVIAAAFEKHPYRNEVIGSNEDFNAHSTRRFISALPPVLPACQCHDCYGRRFRRPVNGSAHKIFISKLSFTSYSSF